MKLILPLTLASLLSINGEAAEAAHPVTISLPPAIRIQFLSNMRDHLAAMSEIQDALAEGNFEQAAGIAGHRLGLRATSSAACRMNKMENSRADNSALSKFMPKDMHRIGYEMHAAADNFALVAQSSAGDYRKAISALSRVTKQCVACHARFRISRK